MKPDFVVPIKEKLPRICYILGGEDNPLKVGETFTFDGSEYNMGTNGYGEHWPAKSCKMVEASALVNMIEHPEKIIRHPQFSEDEKALMRVFVKAGYPIFNREKHGGMAVQSPKGFWCQLPEEILPSITSEMGDFNAAEYLEGLEK